MIHNGVHVFNGVVTDLFAITHNKISKIFFKYLIN